MLAQAFSMPEVARVVASTMAVDAGSRRALETLGMRHVHSYLYEWDDPIPGWKEGEVDCEVRRVTSSRRGPSPPSG